MAAAMRPDWRNMFRDIILPTREAIGATLEVEMGDMK